MKTAWKSAPSRGTLSARKESVPYGNPQKLGTHTLCGHRVAVPSGSTAELQWLPQLSKQDCTSKGKPAIKPVSLPSVNDALTQLVSKRIDAVMYDFTSLEWAAAQQPKTFDVLKPLVATKPATVALKKNSPLTPAVKAALQSIIDDPKYTQALERWGLKDLGIKTAAMAVPQD